MLATLAPPYSEYAALKAELAHDPDGLNAPSIMANMERWRWMPRVLETDRIVINAADASLQLWLGGQAVLTSRVIVGRPGNPTPILRAEGAGVTLNPAWTVPQSIAIKEILPKLKHNHAYLASQDMVLLNGPPGDPARPACQLAGNPADISIPQSARSRVRATRWGKSSWNCPTASTCICTTRPENLPLPDLCAR